MLSSDIDLKPHSYVWLLFLLFFVLKKYSAIQVKIQNIIEKINTFSIKKKKIILPKKNLKI